MSSLSRFSVFITFLCVFLDHLVSVSGRNTLPIPPTGFAYWGIHAHANWYDADAQTVLQTTEASVGRKFDIDRIYNIFGEVFPFTYHNWTAAQGRIPLISLEAINTTARLSWASIANGAQDTFLTQLGQKLAAWPYRFFFCFHHEMDLAVCPNNVSSGCDSTLYNGVSGDYVNAYTHIRMLFDSLGVNLATYVVIWSEALWGSQASLAASFFPGSAVVDWLGLDAYNFIASGSADSNFAQYSSLRAHVSNFHNWARNQSLPVVLAEFGCKEFRPSLTNASTWQNNSKALWLEAILTDWPVYYPEVKAFTLFNVMDSALDDWSFNSSVISWCAYAGVGLNSSMNWWNSGAASATGMNNNQALSMCSSAALPSHPSDASSLKSFSVIASSFFVAFAFSVSCAFVLC